MFVAPLLTSAAIAAEPARPFSQSLTAEQKQRLGLASLTPAQLAELDAAIGAYTRGEATVAVRQTEQKTEERVQQAVQQAERKSQEKLQQAEKKAASAAEAAVTDYKKKQEPGVVARTLEIFKKKQEEDKRERFTARVVGPFRGWSGGTYFPLENGQVWKQTGTEMNELPLTQNAEVEIFQSKNGYWRLRYDSAWITVKRLQ
ncbi:MAG: hypothetical protein EXS37_10225 [Opitutus sp.]|nr:hypothetical protein [Opitutus sp.]